MKIRTGSVSELAWAIVYLPIPSTTVSELPGLSAAISQKPPWRSFRTMEDSFYCTWESCKSWSRATQTLTCFPLRSCLHQCGYEDNCGSNLRGCYLTLSVGADLLPKRTSFCAERKRFGADSAAGVYYLKLGPLYRPNSLFKIRRSLHQQSMRKCSLHSAHYREMGKIPQHTPTRPLL